MELIKYVNNQRFELSNERISYMFQVSAEGLLEHLYFGSYIDTQDNLALPSMPRRVFRPCTLEFEGVHNYNLSDVAQEYRCFGSSDMRHPAFHAESAAPHAASRRLPAHREQRVRKRRGPDQGAQASRAQARETSRQHRRRRERRGASRRAGWRRETPDGQYWADITL